MCAYACIVPKKVLERLTKPLTVEMVIREVEGVI
jgi:hypothetical protein